MVPWLRGDKLQVSSRKLPALRSEGQREEVASPVQGHLQVVGIKVSLPGPSCSFQQRWDLLPEKLPGWIEGVGSTPFLPCSHLLGFSQAPPSPQPHTGRLSGDPVAVADSPPARRAPGGAARSRGICLRLKMICRLPEIQTSLSVYFI